MCLCAVRRWPPAVAVSSDTIRLSARSIFVVRLYCTSRANSRYLEVTIRTFHVALLSQPYVHVVFLASPGCLSPTMTSNRFGQFNRHSQKKAYYTVCLSNLQQTVNKEDIRNHFLNVDRTCRPKIAALVPALELGFQSTTVTFLTEPNRAHRRSQVEKLMNAPLIHSEQNVSRVIISDDWSGVRPLAQSHSEPSVE